MNSSKTLFCLLGLLALTLACCGSGADKALNTKIINDGSYPMTSFHCQPTGTIADTDWQTADWGQNLLPVAQLNHLEFVIVQTLDRINCDAMATFDNSGTVAYYRHNEIRADWLNEEYITVHMAMDDQSSGGGHSWGLEEYPGEQDVTP